MDGFASAALLLPPEFRAAADSLPSDEKGRCEEFRLRSGRPMSYLVDGREYVLPTPPVEEKTLRCVLEAASGHSLHAVSGMLARGYVAARDGVRVGVCGVEAAQDGQCGLRAFSSAAIRIPREVKGCAEAIWPTLCRGGFRSTLLVSPPGAGKTTLLRELCRRLSADGIRVCAADERGEIAGGGGFDLGPCTDVMTGTRKALAAERMLRTMNPQVIAMDEITSPEDARALMGAAGCGVVLLATVHGTDIADVRRRAAVRALLAAGAFSRCVTVTAAPEGRKYRVEEIGCA